MGGLAVSRGTTAGLGTPTCIERQYTAGRGLNALNAFAGLTAPAIDECSNCEYECTFVCRLVVVARVARGGQTLQQGAGVRVTQCGIALGALDRGPGTVLATFARAGRLCGIQCGIQHSLRRARGGVNNFSCARRVAWRSF